MFFVRELIAVLRKLLRKWLPNKLVLTQNNSQALNTLALDDVEKSASGKSTFFLSSSTALQTPLATRANLLQNEIDSLEQVSDVLSKKLHSLRKSRAIETDIAVKLKLDAYIEETEFELEQVHQKLDQIELQQHQLNQSTGSNLEQCVSFEKLYAALLKLGYWEQQRTFKKVIKDHSFGAFLIHGSSPEYGQRWLLNRLVLEISKSIEGKVIRVNLGRLVSRTDVPALWRELASRFGLNRSSPTTKIVEQVYQWWQTQNVIFVFDDAHCILEENLYDLVQNFWVKLASNASNSNQKNCFKLLVFFLDHQGCVCSWKLNLAKQYYSNWKPIIPVALPEISLFSTEELVTWIEQQSDALPSHLTDEVEVVVKGVLEKTDNGLPEPTLQEICDLCDCKWYDQEDKWLKI